ncbi:NAD(P)/FAD-dependent oxidoreductase [Nocardia pseudovaccinii]|uniref:NAD(P)/FAD-dependent oxidoreductase n=1 Tax=Nocardia pseudovaccinii TaxID=189540 RepID=UPI0007A40EAD|nr:FAD/NAD(P)-binding oxidoreductase [Nocardia pseudovaccinii]
MSLRQVTIVGGSVAGLGVAQALRRRGFDGTITVLDGDPEPAIQRPALSKRFLTNGLSAQDIRLHADLDGIDLRLGVRATGFSLPDRILRLRHHERSSDELVRVDGLAIATGAQARTLPLPPLRGVHVLRTLADAEALRAELSRRPRIAILGGGFVGSEVASSCRALGLEVTLLEAEPGPMSRVLGAAVGQVLAAVHRDHGTHVMAGARVVGLTGEQHVEGVRLADGQIVSADVVLIAVGARPAVDWLADSGLDLADGVRCGGDLTVAGGVVAVGDIARWSSSRGGDMRVEHWENAVRQAEVAAESLLDPGRGRRFDATTMVWSDQYDCKLQLIGHPQPGDEFSVIEGSLEERRFVGLYAAGGRVRAALLCNQPHRIRAYRGMVESAAALPLAAGGMERASVPVKADAVH